MIRENRARNTVSIFAPRARSTGRASLAVAPGVPVAPAHAAPPEYVGAAKNNPARIERRNAHSIAARKYRAIVWYAFWPPGWRNTAYRQQPKRRNRSETQTKKPRRLPPRIRSCPAPCFLVCLHTTQEGRRYSLASEYRRSGARPGASPSPAIPEHPGQKKRERHRRKTGALRRRRLPPSPAPAMPRSRFFGRSACQYYQWGKGCGRSFPPKILTLFFFSMD